MFEPRRSLVPAWLGVLIAALLVVVVPSCAGVLPVGVTWLWLGETQARIRAPAEVALDRYVVRLDWECWERGVWGALSGADDCGHAEMRPRVASDGSYSIPGIFRWHAFLYARADYRVHLAVMGPEDKSNRIQGYYLGEEPPFAALRVVVIRPAAFKQHITARHGKDSIDFGSLNTWFPAVRNVQQMLYLELTQELGQRTLARHHVAISPETSVLPQQEFLVEDVEGSHLQVNLKLVGEAFIPDVDRHSIGSPHFRAETVLSAALPLTDVVEMPTPLLSPIVLEMDFSSAVRGPVPNGRASDAGGECLSQDTAPVRSSAVDDAAESARPNER